MPQPTAKLYIFDADGTLRWTTIPGQPCPNRPGEWRLMPNVKEILRQMNWGPGGSLLGVASNQGGVALGYLTKEMAYQLIEATLVEAIGFIPPGAIIDMCVCPPDARCACRKPNPGMLLHIMQIVHVAPEETLFIGDLEIDQEAARRAGVAFIWAHEFFHSPSVPH
jgi:D-glycero-D-manno-heptose 1,7-bisphosphate phosphatase